MAGHTVSYFAHFDGESKQARNGINQDKAHIGSSR
jgi:hypothetical protein